MSQQEKHDQIAEEQDAPKLIADIQTIYKTDAANAQSLARIRSRLQHRATALPTESLPVPFPIGCSSRKKSEKPE
jgi:hypothetical protein